MTKGLFTISLSIASWNVLNFLKGCFHDLGHEMTAIVDLEIIVMQVVT